MNQEILDLRADVDELKEEIALLKGVTPPDMANQISELTSQVKTLKDEVNTLKNTLNNQNLTILKLLEDQKQLIASLTQASCKIPLLPKPTSVFPLGTIEELKAFEASLNDGNLTDHIETMRIAIGNGGLRRNLNAILTEELIMKVNIRGIANKVSLNTYTNFMNVLYQASATGDEWNLNVFLQELQRAIKLYKNRIYKGRFDKNRAENSQGQVMFEEIFFDEDDDETHK